MDPREKVILVTGASSGIGRETARAFALHGGSLALTGRNEAALRAVGQDIRNEQGMAEWFPFDLNDLENIPSMVSEVEARLGGPVDILVNCAGAAVLGFVDQVPLEAFSRILRVNFLAPLALIQAVIPGMKRNGRGLVVNISSGAAKRGLPGASAYGASKAALDGLTESLRVELAPLGIGVLLFSPGLADTQFNRRMEVVGEVKEKFERGRRSSPVSIARRLVKATRRGEREVALSLRTRLARHLNYWAPAWLDRWLIGRTRSN